MIRATIFVVIAGGLLGALVYYLGYPATTATSTVHQTIDNHTTVVVSMPTDFSGIALTIISIAILIYVVGIIGKTFVELWRRRQP